MKYKTLFTTFVIALLSGCTTAADNSPKTEIVNDSPKLNTGNANPLLDFMYVADPTAVVHNGRVYVYGSNDNQEFAISGKDVDNTYNKIHSLVMMSSDDMVNWTYHGVINVASIAPWTRVSWAPSATSCVGEDGKTHFYIYYSQGGSGVGVLTSTSPVGPWSDPLGRHIVDPSTPGLVNCPAPFDPGVTIDKEGRGWLSFGGGDNGFGDYMPGTPRIVKLGKNMISLDSKIAELPAPYFFEASELNFINDTWVYTYNTSWKERTIWPHTGINKPSICCMSYMTSKTPLDKDSWVYRDNYFKNPGDYGMPWGNNHTTLCKFEGEYYIFYHTLSLRDFRGMKTGYRSVCVEKMKVDENQVVISMGRATAKGPAQIRPMNPFIWQQAETTAATQGARFEPVGALGNMAAIESTYGQCTEVRGINFSRIPTKFEARMKGKGRIEVRQGSKKGTLIASLKFDCKDWAVVSTKMQQEVTGTHNLCFVFVEGNFRFDEWKFE